LRSSYRQDPSHYSKYYDSATQKNDRDHNKKLETGNVKKKTNLFSLILFGMLISKLTIF